jgi:hypothetical protein
MASVVEEQEIEAVRKGFGDASEIGAERLLVGFLRLPEEALSIGRFDRSITLEAPELLRRRTAHQILGYQTPSAGCQEGCRF